MAGAECKSERRERQLLELEHRDACADVERLSAKLESLEACFVSAGESEDAFFAQQAKNPVCCASGLCLWAVVPCSC